MVMKTILFLAMTCIPSIKSSEGGLPIFIQLDTEVRGVDLAPDATIHDLQTTIARIFHLDESKYSLMYGVK